MVRQSSGSLAERVTETETPRGYPDPEVPDSKVRLAKLGDVTSYLQPGCELTGLRRPAVPLKRWYKRTRSGTESGGDQSAGEPMHALVLTQDEVESENVLGCQSRLDGGGGSDGYNC